MTAPVSGGDRKIALAAVAGAHGIKGELRLKLFSDSADGLGRHRRLYVGGTERRLLAARDSGKMAVVHFEGLSDRAGAEALRGSLVEIDRDAMPPLGEGEYYYADIIGLLCVDGDGQPLGEVVAVENFGAGDLLEIQVAAGGRALIPFRDGIADLVDGRVVVDSDFLA